MEDLSKLSTEVLRAEIHARDEAERKARWAKLCEQHPCPVCGADPQELKSDVVEEFRSAPRDSDGRPNLLADYRIEGQTDGVLWQLVVTCVNGHETATEHLEWFKEPRKGPSVLH